MSQDSQVTAAFLAAVSNVDRAFSFSKLSEYRREKIKKLTGIKRKKCECEVQEKISSPNFVPVLQTGSDSKGVPQFLVLPVYYSIDIVGHGYLPYAEICEIPQVQTACEHGSLTTLDSHLENIGNPVVITLPRPFESLEMLGPDDLWHVRRAVLQECWFSVGKKAVAYLSVFETPAGINLPKELTWYQRNANLSLQTPPFERHHDRMIFSYENSKFFVFTMHSFALAAKDLNELR